MSSPDFLEENYPQFVECLPNLFEAFDNSLDKVKVSKPNSPEHLVAALCKLCFDRFNDICILASHGRGDGCSPLVRAMFEGLVSAAYIHKHPEKAEEFVSYGVKSLKKFQTLTELYHDKTLTVEEKEPLERAWKLLADTEGNLPGPDKGDWTQLNHVERAIDVELKFGLMVAYYRQLQIAHPSYLHVHSQTQVKDGVIYLFAGAEEASQQRLKEAIIISHRLAIEVLIFLNNAYGNAELAILVEHCERDQQRIGSGIESLTA